VPVRPILALLLVSSVLAGCGVGNTTIIQSSTSSDPASVFMSEFSGKESSQPSEFSFSVSGDLVATGLEWKDWGSPTATGSGTLTERPSGQAPVDFQGTVTVTGLVRCRDASYYTKATVSVPPDAPFQPQIAPLPTPCG
jgi:hypothetical protein